MNVPSSGIQMLLKSLGFDPVDFATKIADAQKTAKEVVEHFDKRLAAIEARLTNIEGILVSQPSAVPVIEAAKSKGNGKA